MCDLDPEYEPLDILVTMQCIVRVGALVFQLCHLDSVSVSELLNIAWVSLDISCVCRSRRTDIFVASPLGDAPKGASAQRGKRPPELVLLSYHRASVRSVIARAHHEPGGSWLRWHEEADRTALIVTLKGSGHYKGTRHDTSSATPHGSTNGATWHRSRAHCRSRRFVVAFCRTRAYT